MRIFSALIAWGLFTASACAQDSYRTTVHSVWARLNELAKNRLYAQQEKMEFKPEDQREEDELRSRLHRLNPIEELDYQLRADINAVAGLVWDDMAKRQRVLDLYLAFLTIMREDLPKPESQKSAEEMALKMRCAVAARDLEWAKRIAHEAQKSHIEP